MTVEEAKQRLAESGLRFGHRNWNPQSTITLFIVGNPNLDEEITFLGWACYLRFENNVWVVAPPPLPCPGPGAEFSVTSLSEAVDLVLFFYRNQTKEVQTPDKISIENTEKLFAAYRRQEHSTAN